MSTLISQVSKVLAVIVPFAGAMLPISQTAFIANADGQAGSGYINVSVVDAVTGHGIPGAAVHIIPTEAVDQADAPLHAITSMNGMSPSHPFTTPALSVSSLPGQKGWGDVTVSVSAPGYKTYTDANVQVWPNTTTTEHAFMTPGTGQNSVVTPPHALSRSGATMGLGRSFAQSPISPNYLCCPDGLLMPWRQAGASAGTSSQTVPASATLRAVSSSGRAQFLDWGANDAVVLYRDRIGPGGGQLWTLNLQSRVRHRLGQGVADAAFTRDGHHVVYAITDHAGHLRALVRIDLAGGHRHQILGRGFTLLQQTSESVGGRLDLVHALLANDVMAVQRDRRVFRLNVMQGSLVPLGIAPWPLPQSGGSPLFGEAISLDAKHIAAFSDAAGLVIFDVGSGRPVRQLVPPLARAQQVERRWGGVSTQPVTKVAWSPDSRHLTFQLGVLDGALISTEVLAGRSLVLKRLGLGHVVSGLTWSPNGRCLALADTVAGSQTELLQEVQVISAGGGTARTLDAHGSDIHWLVSHEPGQSSPVWSRDGISLGFTRLSHASGAAGPDSTNAWVTVPVAGFRGGACLISVPLWEHI